VGAAAKINNLSAQRLEWEQSSVGYIGRIGDMGAKREKMAAFAGRGDWNRGKQKHRQSSRFTAH